MKRITVILVLFSFLCSCSLQSEVTPRIFVNRLINADDKFVFDEYINFSHKNIHTYYFNYSENLYPVIEIWTDGHGNARKIDLACTQTDMVDLFTECTGKLISVYAPEENVDDIINVLYGDKSVTDKFNYYESQWYLYSAIISGNGIYFSVENKKISPQSEIQLSLKANDKVGY